MAVLHYLRSPGNLIGDRPRDWVRPAGVRTLTRALEPKLAARVGR